MVGRRLLVDSDSIVRRGASGVTSCGGRGVEEWILKNPIMTVFFIIRILDENRKLEGRCDRKTSAGDIRLFSWPKRFAYDVEILQKKSMMKTKIAR